MSVLLHTFPIDTEQSVPAPVLRLEPMLRAAPSDSSPGLLEYRGDEDPDVEFIPKTVAGFALGALAMGVSLDLAETMWFHHGQPLDSVLPGMIWRFAFMLGIMGVSSSLLLVGLKVRADRSAVTLYARHWLNSIGTGSAFALMMYVPWIFVGQAIMVNRFLAAVVLMGMMTFPALAAKWTIGPHHERGAAV